MELLQNALKHVRYSHTKRSTLAHTQEIDAVSTVDEFVSSDSATPMMIISYNKRKQGKAYVKSIFTSYGSLYQSDGSPRFSSDRLLGNLIEQNEPFSASPTGDAPNIPLLTGTARKDPCSPYFPALTFVEQCELFLHRILETIDSLPYGFRLICKHIYDQVMARFKVRLTRSCSQIDTGSPSQGRQEAARLHLEGCGLLCLLSLCGFGNCATR